MPSYFGIVSEIAIPDRPPVVLKAEYEKVGDAGLCVTAYSAEQPLRFQDIVSAVIPDAGTLPVDIAIDEFLFAYYSDNKQTHTLLAIDIGTSIDLAGLPLVGHLFPAGQHAGIRNLRLIITTGAVNKAVMTALNTQLPDGMPAFPEVALDAHVVLTATAQIGDAVDHLLLGVAAEVHAGIDATASRAPAAPAGDTKWIDMHKTLGPLSLARIGISFQQKQLHFFVDASLSLSGLTLSLDGLGVATALDHFSPEFQLRGLGVDYASGPVEIGGAFLHAPGSDEYAGAAIIKTEDIALRALGAYADQNGHTSLFIYAVLDYPLGGPSFFFVTGLAAGFGYNRTVAMPPIDRVAQFPLVEEAVSGGGHPDNPLAELEKLHAAVPPANGAIVLAAGVHFTSWEMIDSFALLIVKAMPDFEIDVLGLSTLIVPTPEAGDDRDPLAEVQLALRATFRPVQGMLGVEAQLTAASYLLSRNCHLFGGFAFYSWLMGQHAGDFVYTMGGYHPAFHAPAHYPQVPRLGFNWQVDSHITISGQAYYALTAGALMAGGHLSAVWHKGAFRAWFDVGADFLISWKPYHYDASFHVDIGASYTLHIFGTHTISVDVGADLHVWGPEFAGTASIEIAGFSVSVDFGARDRTLALPIDWNTFKSSFLPSDDQICSITASAGLLRSVDVSGQTWWIVSAKELRLTTNALVPSNAGNVQQNVQDRFGIAPMGIRAGTVTSRHAVTITREGVDVTSNFQYVAVSKQMPAGLWGDTPAVAILPGIAVLPPPNPNGTKFVTADAGYSLTPATTVTAPDTTAEIDKRELQYETETVPNAYAWDTAEPAPIDAEVDAQRRRGVIRASLAADVPARADIAALFDIDIGASGDAGLVDQFLDTPQIMRHHG